MSFVGWMSTAPAPRARAVHKHDETHRADENCPRDAGDGALGQSVWPDSGNVAADVGGGGGGGGVCGGDDGCGG